MVHVATQEIWESFGLGREGGARSLAQMPTPQPSQEYLGRKEAGSQEQEAVCIHSYRKVRTGTHKNKPQRNAMCITVTTPLFQDSFLEKYLFDQILFL